ncbi:hypothetical protein WDW86_22325 [Bdellovibrionota bacterium FG-2]
MQKSGIIQMLGLVAISTVSSVYADTPKEDIVASVYCHGGDIIAQPSLTIGAGLTEFRLDNNDGSTHGEQIMLIGDEIYYQNKNHKNSVLLGALPSEYGAQVCSEADEGLRKVVLQKDKNLKFEGLRRISHCRFNFLGWLFIDQASQWRRYHINHLLLKSNDKSILIKNDYYERFESREACQKSELESL